MIDIKDFIRVAKLQSTGQGTTIEAAEFARKNSGKYKGLNIEISFGIGRATNIPWIALTGFNQKVQKGIYPVFLYYKDFNLFILCYGISETNTPIRSWRVDSKVKTVRQYFEENKLNHPRKYGNSLIYKVYSTDDIENDIIIEDLDTLIEEYIETMENNDKNTPQPEKTIIESKAKVLFESISFKKSSSDSNLFITSDVITRFIASLLTKPFLILTGLSGSGKTKLAQAFSKWICSNKAQYCIVPVGADWTNREPLLGYANALNPDEYIKPDNGALDLLIRANEYPDDPHFLILDEMNLSHVERYFADFLSVMESKEEINLYAGSQRKSNDGSIIPPIIGLSENLFLIGTVNIDETTYMFSPKVLDRANVIEFRVSSFEIKDFLTNPKSVDLKLLEGKGADMAKSFLNMSQNQSFNNDEKEVIKETLVGFFGELKKLGAEFGYRSANEIVRLINQLGVIDSAMTINTKIDIAIMQKLLPKLHGSRRKLTPVLLKLGEFCLESGKVEKIENDVFGVEEFDCSQAFVKYPVSLEKLIRMYKGAVENGFASYAEA